MLFIVLKYAVLFSGVLLFRVFQVVSLSVFLILLSLNDDLFYC